MAMVLEVRAKLEKFGDDCLPRLDMIGRLGRRTTSRLYRPYGYDNYHDAGFPLKRSPAVSRSICLTILISRRWVCACLRSPML
jgi:hypothetical protein